MRSTQLALDSYDTDKVPNRNLELYDPILQPWVDKRVKLLEIGVDKGGSLLLWRDYFPIGTIVGIDIDLPKGFSPGERIHVFEGSQADPRFLSEVANRMAPEGFDIIIDDGSHIGELTRIAFWHLFENHLKPGGLYAIEDWGTGYCDDWPDGRSVSLRRPAVSRLQGRLLTKRLSVNPKKRHLKIPKSLFRFLPKAHVPCHSYGMVGFVKELVDEQGAVDLFESVNTPKKQWRFVSVNTPKRQSRFESVLITHNIVFVRKLGQGNF